MLEHKLDVCVEHYLRIIEMSDLVADGPFIVLGSCTWPLTLASMAPPFNWK